MLKSVFTLDDMFFKTILFNKDKFILFLFVLYLFTSNEKVYSEIRVSINESNWATQEIRYYECRISQFVKPFGMVNIVSEAGENPFIEFPLPGYGLYFSEGGVYLVATNWSTMEPDTIISDDYKNTSDGVKFKITKPLPIVLQKLSMGMNIKMILEDSKKPVSIELSSVNIKDAIISFNNCLTELLPINYEQIKKLKLFYPEKHFRLSTKDKSKLLNMIRYIKIDSSVLGISIETFSDNSGDRLNNLLLSRRRKEEIQNFLVSNGLDEELIEISKHHGQRFSAYNNATEEGRKQNRRAVIKVYKVNEYGELEPDNNYAFKKILMERNNNNKENDIIRSNSNTQNNLSTNKNDNSLKKDSINVQNTVNNSIK